jgi:hypothetical protein
MGDGRRRDIGVLEKQPWIPAWSRFPVAVQSVRTHSNCLEWHDSRRYCLPVVKYCCHCIVDEMEGRMASTRLLEGGCGPC